MDSDSSSSMEDIDYNAHPGPSGHKTCSVCRKRVYDRRHLVKHLRQYHGIGPSVRKSDLKCSFNKDCEFLCSSSEALRNHLKLAHNFNVEKRMLNFPSKADFNKWKAEEEALTNARYVAYSGKKNKSSGKGFYLRCHRTGSILSENQDRKGGKPEQGHTQCEAICPSTIRVSELANGSFQAIYYPDHLGHSSDEESVPCMKECRKNTVEKQEILEESAKDEPGEKVGNDAPKQKKNRLPRPKYLQRRDIYNLKRNGIILEKDPGQDGKMLHAWIKGLDIRHEDKTPIVYYSPLNKYNEYTMVIIHEVQKEAFMHAYDGSIVYVKTKKGKPNIDLNITAVSIVSTEGDAFPIAFCISHKAEYVTLYTLYHTIYRHFGTLKPKFFVSDNLSQSYAAWKNVMGETEKQMICVFDLESIWGQKLAQHRIPFCKQECAANRLKHLLYDLNKERFTQELRKALNDWKGDETMKLFAGSFQRQYVAKCEEWAGWYRTHTDPAKPIDVHLEPLNGIFDAIYVESYTTIGGSLNYLMSYIRDSCLLRVIEWEENYRTEKIYTTERNHARGAEITNMRTNGSAWVFSHNGFDYVVKKIVSNCNQDCGIFCSECDACVHQYNCLCKDYVIGFNLCKHIHAARMAMARVAEAEEGMRQAEVTEKMANMEMTEKMANMEVTEKVENIEVTEKMANLEMTEKAPVLEMNEKKKENDKEEIKKENKTNGEKVEEQKKPKPITEAFSFKNAALSTARSLLVELEKSTLTEPEYRTVAQLLTMLEKRVQQKPLDFIPDIQF